MDENEARYREILQRIAAAKTPPAKVGLEAVLDALNILDTLEDTVKRKPATFFLHGPGVYQGNNWQGVLVWYRRKGWESYKKLSVFGVWAIRNEDETVIIHAGTKMLDYTAAVYNAESYHTLIKRDFRTYYGSSGGAPESIELLYEVQYQPTLRLSLRRAIEQVIKDWFAGLR